MFSKQKEHHAFLKLLRPFIPGLSYRIKVQWTQFWGTTTLICFPPPPRQHSAPCLPAPLERSLVEMPNFGHPFKLWQNHGQQQWCQLPPYRTMNLPCNRLFHFTFFDQRNASYLLCFCSLNYKESIKCVRVSAYGYLKCEHRIIWHSIQGRQTNQKNWHRHFRSQCFLGVRWPRRVCGNASCAVGMLRHSPMI